MLNRKTFQYSVWVHFSLWTISMFLMILFVCIHAPVPPVLSMSENTEFFNFFIQWQPCKQWSIKVLLPENQTLPCIQVRFYRKEKLLICLQTVGFLLFNYRNYHSMSIKLTDWRVYHTHSILCWMISCYQRNIM